MRNPDRAGGGGLIRDHDGAWLKGFARGLGFTNSALAELWALRDGSLLKEIPSKRVIHAFREANQCADALAKLGAQFLSSFVTFCNPPSVVKDILTFDKANLCCNRLVNS
ncbi:uncharacterized protein LOC126690241 [Quercus robur]|uniref:uncharacterized protein LOC126690241 n=1 Tax=Quercus robur TaxID=38942 RepID=UPI0021614D23|nr:uncharacterized protein LOC126690241 [Quercus robur]